MPKAIGINHVALEVGDVDAAVDFYRGIFDFPLRGEVPGAAFLDMGDQFLALSEHRGGAPDEHRHFGLVVDDREAVREALSRPQASRSCPAAASTSATPGETACR